MTSEQKTSNPQQSRGAGSRGQKRQRNSRAATSHSDNVRSGLISINKLDYTLEPDLSVAVSRSYKRHFAQQSSYSPGQRAIMILNSGAEYICGPKSSLVFDIVNTSTDQLFDFGTGSACNVIRRLILTSRSGDEVERVERCNLLCQSRLAWEHNESWSKSVGSAMGVEKSVIPNGSLRCVIPLDQISGLFAHDKLLPSHLASGLRFEIELESAALAVKYPNTATPTSPGFRVENMQLNLDSYQLSDAVQRSLNETAATSGLEIPFVSFHNTQTSTGTSGTALNIEVRKAVSRALTVYVKDHASGDSIDEFKKDSMSSSPWNFKSWQVRVGSLYMPQQPIRAASSVNTIPETLFHSLRSLGKLTNVNTSNINTNDYLAAHALIACDLERSTVQKLSGIPLNNSRTLQLLGEFETPLTPLTSRLVDIYLKHVKLLRVFISNVDVEE